MYLPINKSHYCIIIALLVSLISYGQAGTLDPTFGNNGVVISNFTKADQPTHVAIQQDGKIIIAGRVIYTNDRYDFFAARYHENGNLDEDFGDKGKVFIDMGDNQESVTGLMNLTDGSILVCGWSGLYPNSSIAIVKLNYDGSIDTQFANQGKLLKKFGLSSLAYAFGIQEDGKIIATGGINVADRNIDIFAARFLINGDVDSSFANNGMQSMEFGTVEDLGLHIQALADASILVTGCSGPNPVAQFALAKLNADGTIAKDFGNKGLVLTDLQQSQDVAYASGITNDGKIVAGGQSKNATNFDFAVVRYHANGRIDSSFAKDGKLIHDFNNSPEEGNYLILQDDGKILVSGFSFVSGHNSFILTRYLENGNIDESFGTKGIASADFGSISSELWPSMAKQQDGKIIMVNNINTGNNNIDIGMVRFLTKSEVSTTSVDDPQIIISPNPSSQFIDIENTTDQNIYAELHAIQQHCLQAIIISPGKRRYDFKNLLPGIYVIRSNSGVKKLILTH